MTPRDRSLTGCGACRLRHLKCDESRPGCHLCLTNGLACPGYTPQFKWMQVSHESGHFPSKEAEDRVFRRPLYHSQIMNPFHFPHETFLTQSIESQQEVMTRATTNSLDKREASAALDSLDAWLASRDQAKPLKVSSYFLGPFGILNLSTDKSTPNGQSRLITSHEGNLQQTHDSLLSTPESISVAGTDCYIQEGHVGTSISDETPTGLITPLDVDFTVGTGSFNQSISSQNTSPYLLSKNTTPISLAISEDHSTCPPVPPEAPELLRYYTEYHVSPLLSLWGARNCPWYTIQLPSAKKTYTDLLLHQPVSHTGLSLFFSLLATSALHLASRSDDSDNWGKLRASYEETSRQHLNIALKEGAAGENRVKYKELLMALLSMIMIEIFRGQYCRAQNLLVEAELLIRRRGLPKVHKSLKVRSLHHVYTYLRVMAESTCGCALVSILPQRPNSSLLSTEPAYHLLRSFRVADHTTTTDLDAHFEKSLESGYNDIHLELMGGWNNSLFPKMYGLPESLIGLLSHTIRLANEQELLSRDTTVDVDIVTNLNLRTKALEYKILSWDRDGTQSFTHLTESDTSSARSKKRLHYNSLAVHQGLILFYYRRIHNINALILQDTVRRVLEFAEESVSATSDNGADHLNPTLLWPCFIAACEAVEPDLRDRSLKWLLDADRRTPAPSFSVAVDVARKVWSLRQESKDYTLSWFQAMEPDRCPIIVI